MSREQIREDIGLATQGDETDERSAYDRHMRKVRAIAATVLAVGSALVLLVTGRPVLLSLVVMIGVAGYAANRFDRPKKPRTRTPADGRETNRIRP